MKKNKIPFDLKFEIDNFNNYYDIKEVVKHFFRCSLCNYWDKFDFNETFNNILYPIKNKLAEHGRLSLEDYIEAEEQIMYGNKSDLNNFASSTNYICISIDDIFDAIMEYKYNRYKKEFSVYSSFDMIEEIYNKLLNVSDADELGYKIELFDSCIHAQHETGDIFDEFNPDDIREEIEREYKLALSEKY